MGSGTVVEREIRYLKSCTVFNCEQIDGLPEHYTVHLPGRSLRADFRELRA